MTSSDQSPQRSRFGRLASVGFVPALFMALFLALAGTPGRAEAATVPAAAAQSAAPAPAGQGLLQTVQWHRHGYYRRPYYARRYYRPRYRYYRPVYGPRVVCRIRYGYYGPRRVCFRRW